MGTVGALLGSDEIVSRLEARLNLPDVRVLRLSGPPGSGKSTIASILAARWRAAQGASVIAVGDHFALDREFFPFHTGLTEVNESWGELALEGSRSTLKALDVIQGTGGLATSLFEMLGSARRRKIDRATRTLTTAEKDIVNDLKRLSHNKPLLLVADNFHWWDRASLSLLEHLQSAVLRKAIPELDRLKVLIVDTSDDQGVIEPTLFNQLTAQASVTERTRLCSRNEYRTLLECFGAPTTLPDALVDRLFATTGGHLKLTDQVCRYLKERGPDVGLEGPEEIGALLDQRLATLGDQAAPLADCLSMASIIGLSFDLRELACAVERPGPEVDRLLKQAEALSLVSRQEPAPRFAHDVLRSYFLARQSTDDVRRSKARLEACIAKLRPGDYGLRGKLLLEAGEADRARNLFALYAAKRLRTRHGVSTVVSDVTEAFPRDAALAAWVKALASGYDSVARGRSMQGAELGSAPMETESALMGAERNYLAALRAMERQTHEGFLEARRIVETWAPRAQDELELKLRMKLLLQQTYVLADQRDEALRIEAELEAELLDRSAFDQDAADLLQIQNRRAVSVHPPEIAQVRVERAVQYFAREKGRRPVALYRALTNHVGVLTQLGRYKDAFSEGERAEALVLEDAAGAFPRRDVLAHNMALAGLRSGQTDPLEAVRRQTSVVESADGEEDDFLQRCNLAAFELLSGDLASGSQRADRLCEEIDQEGLTESFLVYYARTVQIAAVYLAGRISQARDMHEAFVPYVAGLNWTSAPYIKRRHQLWGEVLREGGAPERDTAALDLYVVSARPLEIGPCWNHYGRFIPCVELSFWLDS